MAVDEEAGQVKQSETESTPLLRIDAPLLITAFLVLLFLVPARLVLPSMGAAGHPAVFLGAAMLVYWLWTRTSVDRMIPGRQPVRSVLAVYGLAIGASLVVALGRGAPGIEMRAAGRFLITMSAAFGLALVTADLVRTRAELDRLLLRLSYAGGFLAALGVVQFFAGIDVASHIRVPGLRLNADLLVIGARGDIDLRRVAGTANHYIEFGVVLALILPIAVHYALHSVSRVQAQARWASVLLIAMAIPFSISRSAVLAVGVAMLVVMPAWTGRMQVNGILITVLFLGAMRAAVPGLLGTIKSLFLNLENDPSIAGRTQDYSIVYEYVSQRPWFGRGPGTFIPESYLFLDNEWLGTLVTLGLVGTVALAAIFLTGIHLAGRSRDLAVDPSGSSLGLVLTASLLGAVISLGTFDALAFGIFRNTLFLVVGAIGAHYRLSRTAGSGGLVAREPRRSLVGVWSSSPASPSSTWASSR